MLVATTSWIGKAIGHDDHPEKLRKVVIGKNETLPSHMAILSLYLYSDVINGVGTGLFEATFHTVEGYFTLLLQLSGYCYIMVESLQR